MNRELCIQLELFQFKFLSLKWMTKSKLFTKYEILIPMLRLTEYCREEFETFTTFLTLKKCRNWPVSGEIGQFSE